MADAYILVLLPLALTVLVWHEAGHLLAARLARVHTSAFVIGVGPTLLHAYTGCTAISTDEHTRSVNPQRPWPRPGQAVICFVREQPDGNSLAVALAHPADLKRPPAEIRERLTELYCTTIVLPGLMRAVQPGGMTIAPMCWQLRLVPVAAAVLFPQDPAGRHKAWFNNAGYGARFGIIAAGVLANILLFLASVTAAAWMPAATAVRIADLPTDSPAYRAGLRAHDTIITIGLTQLPSREQTATAISTAHRQQTGIAFTILRGTERSRHRVEFTPRQPDGSLTLALSRGGGSQLTVANAPQMAYRRIAGLLNSMADIVRPNRGAEISDAAGPLRAAMDISQLTRQGGLRAWLLILGVISLTAAALNFLPIPPMDGGKAMLLVVEFCRRGRQLSPRWETLLSLAGMLAIVGFTAFMVLRDLVLIAG